MTELTDLQGELLKVLKENSKTDGGLFPNNRICSLTSSQIVSRMKIKPSSENYITRMLQYLQKKGKVKIIRKQIAKRLTRIVTIL